MPTPDPTTPAPAPTRTRSMIHDAVRAAGLPPACEAAVIAYLDGERDDGGAALATPTHTVHYRVAQSSNVALPWTAVLRTLRRHGVADLTTLKRLRLAFMDRRRWQPPGDLYAEPAPTPSAAAPSAPPVVRATPRELRAAIEAAGATPSKKASKAALVRQCRRVGVDPAAVGGGADAPTLAPAATPSAA